MATPIRDAAHGGLNGRHPDQLTPAQLRTRRRNRFWLVGITVATLTMLAVGFYIGNRTAGPAPPTPSLVPAGYKSVADNYFAYAVPSRWATSSLYSDFAGDLYNGDSSGWAAESVSARITAPVLGEPRPKSFEAFGEDPPRPYQISRGHPIAVTGATVAFEYTITRPGGFTATAVDAWQASSGAELWLLIDASSATTAEILSTLRT
jgi:hypothetical protein